MLIKMIGATWDSSFAIRAEYNEEINKILIRGDQLRLAADSVFQLAGINPDHTYQLVDKFNCLIVGNVYARFNAHGLDHFPQADRDKYMSIDKEYEELVRVSLDDFISASGVYIDRNWFKAGKVSFPAACVDIIKP